MLALEAIISALGFIAIAIFLGQLIAAGFLLPAGEPAALRLSLIKSGFFSLVVFLGISLVALLVQGAKIQRAIPSPDLLWRYLTMTQSGHVWLGRSIYALLLALIIGWFCRNEAKPIAIRWLALLSLPLIASRSLMSHAVAVREGAAATVTADAIHLIATALWAGGLIALWWALSPGARRWHQAFSWTAELVDRFSRLALVSVTLLVATGFYQSWIQVGNFEALVSTAYGKTLMLKLVLFSFMLSLGALNFFRTKPELRRLADAGNDLPSADKRRLRRIALESVMGLLIFSATGLLTVLPPGVHALHQAAAANRSKSALTQGNAQPLAPADGARVKILLPSPEQIFTGDKVALRFALTKGKRGQHVHAYVDGELMGMFESQQGTLNGIRSGQHTLELRVVAADHQTELNATDRLEFIVK
jgi:putative copper export protein